MSQRILLVDHDVENIERTRTMLVAAGYEVVVAQAAEEGLALFESHHPELTVIEANLPGRCGADLCREIKQMEVGVDRAVVIVNDSDNVEPDWIAALAQSGCDQLVDRSVNAEDFIELCRELIPGVEETVAEEECDDVEPAEAVKVEHTETESVEAEQQPDDGDALLGQNEVGDALGRLSSIMDEPGETSEESIEMKTKGGDFSHLLDEQLNRDIPAPEAKTEETPASAVVLPEPAEREVSPTPEVEPQASSPIVASFQADDAGDDITAHLDDLFAGDAEPEAPAATAAPMTTAQPDPVPAEQPDPVAAAQPPVEPQARPVAQPIAPPDPAKIDLPASPAGKAPVAGSTEGITRRPGAVRPEALWKTTDLPKIETGKGTGNRFWLIAACVGILLIGAGFMFLRGGKDDSGTTPSTTVATGKPSSKSMAVPATPPAVPRASAGNTAGTNSLTAGLLPAAGEPGDSQPAATEPRRSSPESPTGTERTHVASVGSAPRSTQTLKLDPPKKPEPVKTTPVEPKPTRPAAQKPAAARTAAVKPAAVKPAPTKPAPTPSVTTQPKTPVEARVDPPATTPVKRDEPARPDPAPVATPKPVVETPAPEKRAPAAPVKVDPPVKTLVPVPVKTTPSETPVVETPVVERPAPAPAVVKPAPPAEPVMTQPELLDRIEATFPPKAKKRGEGGTVVLNVLVSETGRIIRVVVEEGVRGSDLEAAAVSAVLRWRYRPATEDGKPVRAWTTARFVFE